MKESEIRKMMSSSPFGDNASYTNSASKYWSDNDIKFLKTMARITDS